MVVSDTILCHGHPLVSATHRTTFEVTGEEHLTKGGTCIIGISAEKGTAALSSEFKEALSRDDAILRTVIRVENHSCTILARGSSGLTLNHPTDCVWRRSEFVCGRTIAVGSDHTAADIPREMIAALQRGATMRVEMSVTQSGHRE